MPVFDLSNKETALLIEEIVEVFQNYYEGPLPPFKDEEQEIEFFLDAPETCFRQLNEDTEDPERVSTYKEILRKLRG